MIDGWIPPTSSADSDLAALSIKRVPSLPMTPTGKISEADLKQQIR
jgi:hypothetical protein